MQTIEVQPKYIVDENGKRQSVILSIEEFEALMEYIEDANDAAVADELIKNSTGERRSIRDVIADIKRDEAS